MIPNTFILIHDVNERLVICLSRRQWSDRLFEQLMFGTDIYLKISDYKRLIIIYR